MIAAMRNGIESGVLGGRGGIFLNAKDIKNIHSGNLIVIIVFMLFSILVTFFLPAIGFTGIALCVILYFYRRQAEQRRKEGIETILGSVRIETDGTLAPSIVESPLPTLIALATTGEIIWTNHSFREVVAMPLPSGIVHLNDIAPAFENRWLFADKNHMPGEVQIGSQYFEVFGKMLSGAEGQLMLLHLFECTQYVRLRTAEETEKTAVAIIAIDNYEELMKNATDSEKSSIIAGIDKALSEWGKDTRGILRKYDRDKYLFFIENQQLDQLAGKKFTVLHKVREIQNREGVIATLSIGFGRDGESLAESHHFAGLAIDMALSRGGDQAVIKNKYTFEFFGGLSAEVAKRTKVKSRVVANALNQLIRDSSQVLIMGHQNSDMDVVGAAAGVVCAVRERKKPVHIVLNRERTMAGDLIDRLLTLPEYEGVFISPEDAVVMSDFNTLLVVVDVNRPGYVESQALLESINKVAVIDHHRRAADYITNSVVSLHEPFASSASELVSELLQYLVSSSNILKKEADAMLAGIYLDTKGFATRTGTRTFEAAAYLRRAGAEVATVKQLFQSSFSQYMERQKVITKARDCGEGIILAVAEESIDRIAASQAADDLLNIVGTKASVVAYPSHDGMAVSARASGQVNVQLLMEQLGGGGNHSAAGAQLSGLDAAEAESCIERAIIAYLQDHKSEMQTEE